MPLSDHARSGHAILRAVLIVLAIGVLVASALMWWWVRESDTHGPIAAAAPRRAGHAVSTDRPLTSA